MAIKLKDHSYKTQSAPSPKPNKSGTVKQVLVCRPNYFKVDYVINPHMHPNSVDTLEALKQWQSLVDVLKSLKVKVEIIEQQKDVPDMVFAADQGLVVNKSVLLANFRFGQRTKETLYYGEWFIDKGYRLRYLSNIFPFEGSNALFFDGMLFMGVGFRGSAGSCEELSQKLKVDVVPLRLVNPFYYQIDMAFLPIDHETAFYYPKAFSAASQNLLKRLVPNLYELSDKAAKAYAANAFVSGRDIIIAKGVPKDFKTQLEKIGLSVHEVDISEFKKAGGGIHCLINVLK